MYLCVYVCESKRREEKDEGEVCVSLALFLTTTCPLILGLSVPNTLPGCVSLLNWLLVMCSYIFCTSHSLKKS